ncbi:hypothetical protein V0M98_35345 (plasmid) [Pseudomonas silesiensis]|uniref:hypothetical protein n=1 Tax=Pseudomonas silesiensis TaxID=1853130 RepID=UPI0030CD9BC6
MTAYRVEDLLQGIVRGFDTDPDNHWLDVEVLSTGVAGAQRSLRLCLELLPRLTAAIGLNALSRLHHSMRPLAMALTGLASNPVLLESTSGKKALEFSTVVCRVIDAYDHSVHDCIEEVGELMEIVRNRYLAIKLGYQLDVMTTFYNKNLGYLPDGLRLPFLKAGDEYVCQMSKVRLDDCDLDIHRLLLTVLDVSSFRGWTSHMFTHPALTAMFSSTFGTMFQYNNPVWVRPEGDVEPRLLWFVDLIEALQPHNLKLASFNVDYLLVCQILDGMRIAAASGTEHTERLVLGAKALAAMVLPDPKNQNKLANNLLKPSLGAKDWIQLKEQNGLIQALCETMEAWFEPSDIAPALSAVRRHFFFCVFQEAGINRPLNIRPTFNELMKVAAPELLEPTLQVGIGKKGRSVLADFAIYTSNEDLKEMLARTPDLQVRSKIFQDDLGL